MVLNDSVVQLSSSIMSNSVATGPAAAAAPAGAAGGTGAATAASAVEESASTITVKPAANNFPPPKTDKPRPHVCTTCQRSFARLEHLKRHERSHTKEKPFECPECARCFARRDLLLRHQQKLHQTSTPSSRPRNRRESASGITPAQARRKNSVAGVNAAAAAAAALNGGAANTTNTTTTTATNGGSMRPRANTISHVDNAAIQMIAATANANAARNLHSGHHRHPSLSGLPANAMSHLFGGLSMTLGQRGAAHGLGKLDTAQMINGGDSDHGLRTAPPMAVFTPDFDFENFVFGSASTINPNALHYNDSPQSIGLEHHQSPFPGTLNDIASTQTFEDTFDWVTGFENQINIRSNEHVIDGSSPSAISTTSQSGMSDVMVDGSNHPAPAGTSTMWQPSVMGPPQLTNPFAMDLNGSVFPDLLNGAPVSPQPASQKINDPYFCAPPITTSMNSLSPSDMQAGRKSMQKTMSQPVSSHAHAHPPPRDIQSPPMLPLGNNGASPITTITEATRSAIVNTLSQSQSFGGRKFASLTTTSKPSPQSPRGQSGTGGSMINLPSVQDLQRYVGSFLKFFHPHLPFLHIPTLSFDMSVPFRDDEGGVGGRGCLLLAMAMIGALYERDETQSKEMFEMSKKMIFLFLEDRRKAELNRAAETRRSAQPGADHSNSQASEDGSDTPLWLVQAMLLNVSYGHNVIDKIATDIASTHCTALVSLCQASGLVKQTELSIPSTGDVQMTDAADANWVQNNDLLEYHQWLEWKRMEERKRTAFSVFLLSSLLVTAYNHAPALTNSELSLDLPCDEDFFAAETSAAFFAKGGIRAAAHNTPRFSVALGELLHSNERQKQQLALNNIAAAYNAISDPGELPGSKLKPSSFSCLLLIYALHNYIWETRQRHHNKVWTNEETEKMHRHIEPALRAWQMAWASNPQHSVERPNPFGLGPLSADAIPLLDLAYVRLFINMAKAKERFWDRDWTGLSAEIAKGSQIVQHADLSPESTGDTDGTGASDPSGYDSVFMDSPATQSTGSDISNNGKAPLDGSMGENEKLSSRREKHLRKASFFAADSLIMSDRLGVSFADRNGHELPLQVALCAFDCLQVLVEWLATLQDRVGCYLGIMGKDKIDFGSMPAIMVLEEDDVKLLEKVENIVNSAENKIRVHLAAAGNTTDFRADDAGGYCSKLLQLEGMMFARAGVWQVYNVMAECLQAQTLAARTRAESSVINKVPL